MKLVKGSLFVVVIVCIIITFLEAKVTRIKHYHPFSKGLSVVFFRHKKPLDNSKKLLHTYSGATYIKRDLVDCMN